MTIGKKLHGKNEMVAPAMVDRRRFMGKAGLLGLGAATLGAGLVSTTSARADTPTTQDSVREIFLSLLVAEDLATTFYYNVLVGQVIQDPSLAGPGGTALNPSPKGVRGNVQYMRAAFFEEFTHASAIRSLLGGSSPSEDPAQTFHFPIGAFDTLASFAKLLATLENAFIGAYLNAIQEFSTKAAEGGAQGGKYTDVDGQQYSSQQLIYFAKASASIMGVESEHRILGRVISDMEPGDNVLYEQLDGLNSLYNGPNSAVAALTPFLTASTGPGFSFATAAASLSSLGLPVQGSPPAAF